MIGLIGRIGAWAKRALGAALSFPITEVQGGTNQTTYTKGDILYASATDTLSKLPIGANGQLLSVASTGVPAWTDAVNLSTVAISTSDFIEGSQILLKTAVSGANALSVNRSAAGSAAHPGAWRLSTGTTNSGYANLFGSDQDNQVKVGGAGEVIFETIVNLSALSNGADTYALLCGLTVPAFSNTLTITDGIYFYLDSNANANWRLRCGASSSTTDGDTGVTATAAWTKLRWVLNAAGTSVQAYVNGVSAGSPVTTNIPPATTGMLLQWFIKKSAGTTAVNYDVDAYKLIVNLSASR
jgi:hypothetical protein